MRTHVFSLLIVSLSAMAHGQADIGKIVKDRMERAKTPGVTVAIIRDGKAEITGYGYADLENKVPAKAETVYQIGSVTKQFTATMIMMLVEQGKLKLDDSILTHMPDLPAAWKDATVRQLLNHTSGIKSYTSVPAFGGVMMKRATHADLIKLVADEKPDFAPGERWSYNNTGYYVLGMLIERIEKKPYRQALKDMITGPLGMTSTDLYLTSEIVQNRARGYSVSPMAVHNAEYMDMGWPFAAGSILSSALDMVKWDAAQGSTKLLKPESWKQMWTPATFNDKTTFPYGFGWGLAKLPGSEVIEHGGAIPGFQAQFSRYPSKKLSIIVLGNSAPGMVEDLTHDIAAALDPSLAKPAPKAIQDKDPELTKRLRKIFEDALAGKADPSEFGEELRKRLFPDAILMARDQLSPLGALKSFELISESSTPTSKVRVYGVTLGTTLMKLTHQLDAAGKIAGYLIQRG
jgi:CubicO group peptidase (beta-lactamase class C family)